MPYFKYSSLWPRNDIVYYWEVSPGDTESAATIDDGKIEPMSGETSSSCKTKYEKLPLSLKSCLDYCAFITDINRPYIWRNVDKEELVRLMVAEGLIEENGDAFSLEDIAASFIQQLLDLEMLIADFAFSAYEGSVTTVKVSDPYYKLCVVKGNHDDFVARNTLSPIRLIVHSYDDNDISSCLRNLPIQSLFLFISYARLSPANVDAIRGLRSMFVLYTVDMLSNISFKEVGELVNLRFLRSDFSDRADQVLHTLSNLQHLQTLNLTRQFKILPEEVVRMKPLRHLITPFYSSFRLRQGIGRLVNLRSLVGWDARSDVIGELSSLTEMRRLCVNNVVEETVKELLEVIMTMKNLAQLFLGAHSIRYQDKHVIRVFPFLEPFSPPPFLQELHLEGILMEIPSWFASMNNLTTLILVGSDLTENPSNILQFLPRLKHLCLEYAYNTKLTGAEFCEAEGFPKLEILKIRSDALVEWTEIVMGAFPSLTSLTCSCQNLLFFPEGLQNIYTLQELLIGVHEDLIRRLKGDENYKIKHVPSVEMTSSPLLFSGQFHNHP